MGIFDIIYTSGSAIQKIILLLSWLVAITIGIVVHEYMHAYVAYKNGDSTAKLAGRMSLNPAVHFDGTGFLCLLLVGFGWAKGVPINEMNFRDIKKGRVSVALSGALTNIIIGILGLIVCCALSIWFATTASETVYYISNFFYYLSYINLFLGVFNLIPIYPLDGYNVLSAFLPYDNKYCTFMKKYGVMILFILLIFSAIFPQYGIGAWISGIVGGIQLGIFKLFLLFM